MRYRFTSDDDGHDYIIPADKLDDWDKYLSAFYKANDKCEELPDQPEWAVEIDSYTCYSFENWRKE